MGIFGTNKILKTELYFKDNRNFVFIKRELYNSCIVERVNEKIVRASKHFFNCEIPFPGYRKIPADMVTLGFSRDIILDPFDKVPEGTDLTQKPSKSVKDGVKNWIAKIAENQRHIFRALRETHVWTNRLTWLFIGIAVVELLVWAVIKIKGG